MTQTGLRYEKMTYELRRVIFEVHNELKVGWPEEVYHLGLVEKLKSKGVPVQSKPRCTVEHRGVGVHLFECDLIVWNAIIPELKVLPHSGFAPGHYAQLIHYLKCWNMGLGLLVNFGRHRVDIQRVVWDEPGLFNEEDYESIGPYLTEADKLCLDAIRQVVFAIGRQYGIGYPETMYRRITVVELRHNGLSCATQVEIPAKLGNRLLTQHSSDHLLVEGRFLLGIRSMLESPPAYDFARMKTYLNSLGLRLGLIVNFGKKKLQIFGVNST